jgi:adhesin HecA-like repeat protein
MIWGVDATIKCTSSPGTKPSPSSDTCSPTASAVSANRGCDDCGKLRTTDSAGTVVVTAGTVVVTAGTVVVTAGNVVVTAGTVVVTAGTVVVVAGAVGLTEFETVEATLLPIALIAITVKA